MSSSSLPERVILEFVSRDVVNVNAYYKSLAADFLSINLGSGIKFEPHEEDRALDLILPAGRVRIFLQYVGGADENGEFNHGYAFGRIVFAIRDQILDKLVPVHAIQLSSTGTVYKSDSRDEVYESGRGGSFIGPSAVQDLVWRVNFAIVKYYTAQIQG